MDDIFIPLWPPAWVEDHTLNDEQLVAAGEDVKLMSALRSDERVLLSVSWPGGRRYLMIDPHGEAAPEAFRAGETSTDAELMRPLGAGETDTVRDLIAANTYEHYDEHAGWIREKLGRV